jgi:hypothetical protein
MSTGFSFVPARRRSREARGALEPAADGADVGDGCSAGWLRRHAGEGSLQASQALRAGREGRKLPAEGEGPSADSRGNGRVHDERGAKRSGCVSAGIPQIDPTASAHQETSEPRHRLTCGGCATLCDARRSPSSKVWSGQAAKNSKASETGRQSLRKRTDCRSLRVLQPWAIKRHFGPFLVRGN